MPSRDPPSAALERQPASLARRLAALVYDALALCGLLFCFTLAVVAARGGKAVPAGTLWFTAGLVATTFVFFGWFWTHGGQTLGMRAWHLRLVRADASPLTWGDAARRFAASVPSIGALGIGLWSSHWDAERRAWHDRLSGTRVTYEPAASAPARTRES